MPYIYSLIAEHPVLSLIMLAFSLWMLVDAYHRGVDFFWYWIILLVQPIGALAYFFVFKFQDFRNFKGWFHRRPGLQELRYRVTQVPTLANQLALGQRLIEKHEYAEALTYLESALTREPDHSQVLYCQAVCYVEMGQPQKGIPFLERIIARDRLWSDYSAWRLLIQARSETDDQEGALKACRDLVKLAPNLPSLPSGGASLGPRAKAGGSNALGPRSPRPSIRSRAHPAAEPPLGLPGPPLTETMLNKDSAGRGHCWCEHLPAVVGGRSPPRGDAFQTIPETSHQMLSMNQRP